MTLLANTCGWCGGELLPAAGPGRPRRYCRRSHRQRAFEARRAAAALSLGPEDVLISRRSWDSLRSALRRLGDLSSALAADLATGRQPDLDYATAVGRLSAAVGELQDAAEPKAAW